MRLNAPIYIAFLVVRAGRVFASCAGTEDWPGWAGIKYAFIFGDSYTSTSFNVSLAAPSPSNPLGNPPYPGWTSSNGPNWVGFLTTKYNKSLVQTYNLAYGGATVESTLVAPYLPTVLSLREQVQDVFLPTYVPAGNSSISPSWTSGNTLFAFWIGINDVGNSYWKGADATKILNEAIFAMYEAVIRQLFSLGARNFLFLNVPPVDRSPLTIEQGKGSQELEKADILAFNGLVQDLAGRLKDKSKSANVWLYDTYKSFGQVLDDPKAYPQTSIYTNTTGYCKAYQNGTPQQDTMTVECAVPVNQYFWLNSLHPTYPMHDVVAEGASKVLSEPPNVCGAGSA